MVQRIELTGKYAIGEHRYALVDDADLNWLNAWRWKAKPNGGANNIYAIRTQLVDGVCRDIRMHREVLGLGSAHEDPREIDHIDHNGTNNQRTNLRIATRSENLRNARTRSVTYRCSGCGKEETRVVSAWKKLVEWCEACSPGMKESVAFIKCHGCGQSFIGTYSSRQFCSEACRCRARYLRLSRAPRRGASLEQRVVSALVTGRTATDIANDIGSHPSNVREVLNYLASQGRAVKRKKVWVLPKN